MERFMNRSIPEEMVGVRDYLFELINGPEYGLPEYVIETDENFYPTIINPPEPAYVEYTHERQREAQVLIEEVVSVMRIVVPSRLGIRFVWTQERHYAHERTDTKPDTFPAIWSPIALEGDGQQAYGQFEYTFTPERIEMFQAIWSRYLKLRSSKRLMRSIRRYNTAICSHEREDSLVDLIIALETLFQAQGFKVSFLVSFLFSLDEEERRQALCTLEDSYRMRNASVHGGDLDEKKMRIVDQLLPLVGQILSFAILVQMSGKKLADHVREKYLVDDKILSLEDLVAKWKNG
jgi:hypothetical protein